MSNTKQLLYFFFSIADFFSSDPHLSPNVFNSNSCVCFLDRYSLEATNILAEATALEKGWAVKGSRNASPAACKEALYTMMSDCAYVKGV